MNIYLSIVTMNALILNAEIYMNKYCFIYILFNRNPIEINFKELDLTVKMPVDVDCYAMSIRGLWIKYDHYSDQGSSFLMPEIPQEYNMNEGIIY